MKKLLSLLILAAVGIAVFGCDDKMEVEPEHSNNLQEVSVCFTYNLSTDSGASMTKVSNADIFDRFYQRILSADLVADEFSLVLTEVNTGETKNFSGRWKEHNLLTLRTGTYRVTGVSTAYGDTVQEKCSFTFNEVIVVSASTHEIALTARYDCFLIVFSGSDIATIVNYNGLYETPLFSFEQYKYAFVNDKLYKDNYKNEAYVGGTFSDGAAFKCYTGDLAFEKGKYYVYSVLTGGFIIPGMEEGGVNTNDQATVVSLNNAGELGQMIPESERDNVRKLVISGDINGTDFRLIRSLNNLVSLDISTANIVAGGEAFIRYQETAEGLNYPDGYWPSDGGGVGMWAIEDHYSKKDSLEFNFWGMKHIEEIILPQSLKYLGRYTFYGCHKLKTITIPKNTNMGEGFLEEDAFWSCISLESILVEENNPYLFSVDGCLYRITSEGKKELLAVPCAKKYYTMPNDVDVATHYCIPQGSQLEELTLGYHSPVLESYYFGNFLELRRFNVDPNNNLYSEIDGVLYDKDQKTIICYPCQRREDTYLIKDGVTKIGNGSFNTCVFLKEMVIPEGVTDIGESAFFCCPRIEKVTLPSTLKWIDSCAFQQDPALKTIICLATTPPDVYDECTFVGVYPDEILVPAASVSLYQNAYVWKDFASVIKAL